MKLSDLEAEVRQRSEVVSAKETAIAAADRTIATLQAQISHDKDDYQVRAPPHTSHPAGTDQPRRGVGRA